MRYAPDDDGFGWQLREWPKTLRKKNASVVFATQSLSDIDESAIAPALIESCERAFHHREPPDRRCLATPALRLHRHPQLGPALPGDLGGPILRAMAEGKPIPASPLPGPDPAEQRRLAEFEAKGMKHVHGAPMHLLPSCAAHLWCVRAIGAVPTNPADGTWRRPGAFKWQSRRQACQSDLTAQGTEWFF